MGHCSIYGHTQDILNPFIRELVGATCEAAGR